MKGLPTYINKSMHSQRIEKKYAVLTAVHRWDYQHKNQSLI